GEEYKDTKRPLYLLIRRLAEVHRNLDVVGDPDQSIYKWRGADFKNIDELEEADFIARSIKQARSEDVDTMMAVLYRTNAQSRAIEDQLMRESIPYKII